MKKKNGSTLLYVLITLSGLSVFLSEFISFTRDRYKIVYLKNKYSYNIYKKIIQTEQNYSSIIFEKGIFYKKNILFLKDQDEYYNSIIIENSENIKIEKLIYLEENTFSIGRYKILSIKDLNNNIYKLPLEKNSLYPNLIVTYEKTMIEKKITGTENIQFNRKNTDEVIIKSQGISLKGD